MKLFVAIFCFLPLLVLASIEAEVGMYSNFIWRGTTFTENKPALQGQLDAQSEDGYFVGAFFSNAEFSDEALGDHAAVTQETDVMIGKRWWAENWEIQLSYNRFFFPNAGIFDTHEFNLLGKYKSVLFELSHMDDYFGYRGVYQYVRLGHEWTYSPSIEGAFFVGYNLFKNPKGEVKCNDLACTTTGAGNPNYFDLFLVNRKVLKNQTSLELAINWTDRKEYVAENAEATLQQAKDFAIIVAWVLPFTL